jgi:Arc/MetJ-type ribon-helix-helix transcriptional regulator
MYKFESKIGNHLEISVTSHSHSLTDVIQAFEDFLKASGFVFDGGLIISNSADDQKTRIRNLVDRGYFRTEEEYHAEALKLLENKILDEESKLEEAYRFQNEKDDYEEEIINDFKSEIEKLDLAPNCADPVQFCSNCECGKKDAFLSKLEGIKS